MGEKSVTSADPRTIPALFFEQARLKGTAPYVWGKVDGNWRPTSWDAAARAVRGMAAAFQDLGVEFGDRIALIAENQPSWVLADLAIMAAGGITVPAYTTYSADDYRHVLDDSGAKIVILGSDVLAHRVLPAAATVSSIKAIIAFERISVQAPTDLYFWDDLLQRDLRSDLPQIAEDDVACLIYTSGTSGIPRGVMLSHGNILSNARGAHALLRSFYNLKDEVFLSFLPLTHSYEHMAGFVLPIVLGAETYFTSPDSLNGDLPTVRPTIMTAVPRLFEMLQKRILAGVGRNAAWQQFLFRRTLALGRKRYAAPQALTLVERLFNPILTLLVRANISLLFGGRLKLFVSGGAPINPDLALFFIALGVKLI